MVVAQLHGFYLFNNVSPDVFGLTLLNCMGNCLLLPMSGFVDGLFDFLIGETKDNKALDTSPHMIMIGINSYVYEALCIVSLYPLKCKGSEEFFF